MALDNQLLLGTVLFAGIAYIIYQGIFVDEHGNKVDALSKEGEELLQEFGKLKDRLHEFEVFDARKGRFHSRAPLDKDARDGLVEVLTRLKSLEKKQQKKQILNRRHAIPLHNEVADLDLKVRSYLNRFPKAQQEKGTDPRNVAKRARFSDPAANTRAAIRRGSQVHSREASFVADRIASIEEGSVKGEVVTPKKRKRRAKKKPKPNFDKNPKPETVFEQPDSSNNTVNTANAQSGFETNHPQDDTHDHAAQDANMVEATESKAHGKAGTTIAPLEAPPEPKDRSTTVTFNNAPGPVPDRTTSLSHQRGDTAEYAPYSPESERSASHDIVDLTGVPQASFESMEKDLFAHMEALQARSERLTAELDVRLQALISMMYSDDLVEGGNQMERLAQFRARDRVAEQPARPSHPNEETNKRAATQVISAVEKRMETKALSKRVKTSHHGVQDTD